jgi:hypothetical protein
MKPEQDKGERKAERRTDWRCLKMMLIGWTITRWFRFDMTGREGLGGSEKRA